jgi:adenylate kinase family enzyme
VADALAARVGVAATHLDDLHWEPGWVERPWDDLRRRVGPVVDGPAWVVEGNYVAVRSLFLARADLVVWLDLPLSVTVPRLVRRSLDRGIRGTPCCNGNRESLVRFLAPKDSILWWALTTDRRRRREFGRELATVPLVRLRHPAAVGRWLAGSAGRAAGGR